MKSRKYYIEALKSNALFTVEPYSLVSNHGYMVQYKNYKFDIRHWLNLYGVDVDYWSINVYLGKSKTSNINVLSKRRDLIKLMDKLIQEEESLK